MKHLFGTILILFIINLNAQNKTHRVEVGETIENIAKQYLVTPFDIYALNPDAQKKLLPNTVLIIPNSKVKNTVIDEEKRKIIGYKKHRVKRKETLFSISQKYNITVEDIKKTNRHLYSENLRKGDKIKIPQFKTIISKRILNNTIKKYIVLPKEGKWRIAYKFGITVTDLEDLNPLIKAVIQPGDELNVPNISNNEENPIETKYNYYEVLPKEGFFRLKVKLGLTQNELEALNPELKVTGLRQGMVLKIPSTVDIASIIGKSNTIQLADSLTNFNTKKIALLMPYCLHKIDIDSITKVKNKIKNERLLSVVLDFHVGVLMALDSAKQLGISTNLKVFDTRYQSTTVTQLIDANDFSEYDAVIGPMEQISFDKVATKLRDYRVPIIAALNKPKEVYNNVFQTIPEDNLLQKSMLDFIKADTLKSKKIIISDQANRSVSETLKREFPEAKRIFSRIDKETGKDDYFIDPLDLKTIFESGKTIVFLETNNNSFASSIISMLNALNIEDVEIILTTLDKNKAFEGKNIDNYHLSNLKFHYASVNSTFDEENPNSFITTYKNTYGVFPNKYAVRGFDITLDLLLRLAYKDDLYEASNDTIETEYVENKFRYSKSLFGGYVNKAHYIMKYDNLKIIKAN